MPAPGEQHLNSGGRTITNPFEEVKPRISEYTAQEIATLQSRLEKQLGPEYISSRAGPSGQKVHYVAAEKCIQLANEVFGFNGWSSQIMDVQVDFIDENPQTLKVSLGLSVIVRVTLKDGTYHEDVGYGHMENSKGKAAAFEKAKKEGTTDALKRALKNFGNLLGLCIYDKEYLQKVTKVKAQPTKWDVEKLHRHSTFEPPVKKEEKPVEEKSQNGATGASISTLAHEDTFEDEFGDFDEADFSVADPDSHPDEVSLPAPASASHHFSNRNGNSATNGTTSNQNRPPGNRPQPIAALGRPPNAGPNGNNNNSQPQQPQASNSGFARSNSGAGRGMQPPQESGPQSRPGQSGPGQPPVVAGRVLNQPSRTGPPLAPASPARFNKSSDDTESAGLPPQGAGFFSARAVTMLPEGQPPPTEGQGGPPPPLPTNLPVFNPHAESPSIRKTPGVDHKSSKPLTKDLKHVPGSSQALATGAPANGPRPNILNPQLDGMRRIGAPGSPSPMANRGMYKPPTLKRPVDAGSGGAAGATSGNGNAARAPLVDLPANGPIGGGDAGGDVKRQRLNG